ncbi:MAG: hypothetical protein P4N59_18310 [Negativicutes bacterium]|nr:hypothetical protein [Negativicutes bacterium]
MSGDKVLALLGPPTVKGIGSEPYDSTHPDYSGLSLELERPGGLVFSIVTWSSYFAPPRGVRVGDPLAKVFETYGRAYYRDKKRPTFTITPTSMTIIIISPSMSTPTTG